MPRYKNEINQYIKDNIDIVDVISTAVQLKRAGRSHKGLCPFHNEKTPSFVVNDAQQYYHCFGCGESGDVITFVMKYENLEYIDAIESLADRYHLDLSPMLSNEKWQGDDSKALYEIMRLAARHFYQNLKYERKAQIYLKERGIDGKLARHFGLGYARNQWDDILSSLKRKGASEKQLLDCGLIIKNEKGRYYDRFRNRLMFPIFDIRGRVVAFGGRVLDDSLPKYLNSPETLIFHKSNVLYGLNFASKNPKEDTVFLVEGYMDVIAMHKYGFTNTVASLGTALTSEQIKQLNRIYGKLIFAYDGDNAGQKAINKSLAPLADSDLTVKILKLTKGKDPDEVLRKYGIEEFNRQLESSINTLEFSISYFANEYDLNDTAERIKFLERSYNEIRDKSPSIVEFSLNYLADLLHLETNLIKEDYADFIAKNNSKSAHIQTQNKDLKSQIENNRNSFSGDKLYRLELVLLRYVLNGKNEYELIKEQIERFYYQNINILFKQLASYYQQNDIFESTVFSEDLDLEQSQFIFKLVKQKDVLLDNRALRTTILTQSRLLCEKEIEKLDHQIKTLRLSADSENEPKLRLAMVKLLELKKQSVELNNKLKSM